MGNFILVFTDKEEVFLEESNEYPNIHLEGKPLYITSKILETFWSIFKNGIISPETVQGTFLNLKIDERPVTLSRGWENIFKTPELALCAEIVSLANAMAYKVQNSLSAIESTVFERILLPELSRHSFFEYVINERLKQVNFHRLNYEGKGPYKAAFSPSILALCWTEVDHEWEHPTGKYRICPFCGKIYKAPDGHPKSQRCSTSKCKQAYLIESKGGIEGYREWENTRKKTPGKRKRGRPRKSCYIQKANTFKL